MAQDNNTPVEHYRLLAAVLVADYQEVEQLPQPVVHIREAGPVGRHSTQRAQEEIQRLLPQ